jgi:hypothetical protein
MVGLLTIAVTALGAVSIDLPVAAGQPPEETDEQLEYNVKLAFLCNFGRYVEWPAEADLQKSDVWIIGILGNSPFHGELDKIAASQRKIQGRTIVARHFASLDDYQPCHILFVVASVPPEQQQAAIRTLRGKFVLLVGESAGFAASGGCINFYRDEENIRFEINPAAVRGQSLKVSSKLLALAKIVK